MELIRKEEVEELINNPPLHLSLGVITKEDILKGIDELTVIESRPKGEWVETDLDCGRRHIRCNQCWYADCEIPKEKIKDMDYCPQCGAEMERRMKHEELVSLIKTYGVTEEKAKGIAEKIKDKTL